MNTNTYVYRCIAYMPIARSLRSLWLAGHRTTQNNINTTAKPTYNNLFRVCRVRARFAECVY